MCSTTWKRENSPMKFEKLSILANFGYILIFMNLNHVLKKVGRRRSHNLFSFKLFINLHALGYPKSVTIFWFMGFGLNSPSSWCAHHCCGGFKDVVLYFLDDVVGRRVSKPLFSEYLSRAPTYASLFFPPFRIPGWSTNNMVQSCALKTTFKKNGSNLAKEHRSSCIYVHEERWLTSLY
jgi:hypothetical protein